MTPINAQLFKNGVEVGFMPVSGGPIADQAVDFARDNIKKSLAAIYDARTNPNSPWRTDPKLRNTGDYFCRLDFDRLFIDFGGTPLNFEVRLPAVVK